jgi:hypothetical protein
MQYTTQILPLEARKVAGRNMPYLNLRTCGPALSGLRDLAKMKKSTVQGASKVCGGVTFPDEQSRQHAVSLLCRPCVPDPRFEAPTPPREQQMVLSTSQ